MITGVEYLCSHPTQNIVLSGGSTMFQHFGQRLKRDLKQIVDRRLDANNAGSQIRVRPVSKYPVATC